MKTQGHVFKYGDNVDTDVIIPARYLNTADAKELAKHCMEDIDTEYVKKVQPGDIMVAGWNFGCGSSREHAPLVIKTCGTGCVIAKSFARIFYRNAINIGMPILECEAAADEIAAGDEVSIDFTTGIITDHTTCKTYQAAPFPEFIQNTVCKQGFCHKSVHACSFCNPGYLVPVVRGKDYDRYIAANDRTYLFRCLDSVYIGHAPVYQDQIVTVALCVFKTYFFDAVFA